MLRIPTFIPTTEVNTLAWAPQMDEKLASLDGRPPSRRVPRTYTIFEGTSEIQRLVIARAISGMHID